MGLFINRKENNLLKLAFFMLIISGGSVHGRQIMSQTRPDPNNVAPFARWLVSQNSWGVLSTIADDLGGAPFGNVVSFSDGLPDKGAGLPYFYLTTLDPTAQYALKDHRSSFTISEYPLGTCGKADPENPTCSKITLTGKLNEVDAKSEEAATAKSYLFAKHAEMKDWPKDHNFQVFKLDIEEIFLINYFGGPKPLTVDQYLHTGKKGSSAPAFAQWLVSKNSWGVLSIIADGMGGAPFGNGQPNYGNSIPYFYLTTLDPTALKDHRSSFTTSE